MIADQLKIIKYIMKNEALILIIIHDNSDIDPAEVHIDGT